MASVFIEALNTAIQVDRVIGEVQGTMPGPSVVMTGGIHGNEPSGVFALHRVFRTIESRKIPVKGTILGLSGNLWALAKGMRYHQQDLNRLWVNDMLSQLEGDVSDRVIMNEDIRQMTEILNHIRRILAQGKGPYYFIDLHTTSSESVPFLTINDTILNRRFSAGFPVPTILGLEEFIDGPLLSYINELGYVAVGFEAGQHHALSSVQNHESFVWLSLERAGSIRREDIPDFVQHMQQLEEQGQGMREFFEVSYRHVIHESQGFEMKPGYGNFQEIEKDEQFAHDNEGAVSAPQRGRIFMPLYQKQGNDGFFIIRKIPKVWLNLSLAMRKLRADSFLTMLPGVNWHTQEHDTLRVNTRIARFFAKDFFHLMGFRSRSYGEGMVLMKKRDKRSAAAAYAAAPWNKLRS